MRERCESSVHRHSGFFEGLALFLVSVSTCKDTGSLHILSAWGATFLLPLPPPTLKHLLGLFRNDWKLPEALPQQAQVLCSPGS